MKLQDKVALITGGSRGIGKAICLELASHGAHVAFTYNENEAYALETARKIEELGRKAQCYKMDLTDKVEISKVFSNS